MHEHTILIADSETHVVSTLTHRLTAAGYYVVNAVDGSEAYTLARSLRPDLIVADYQLRHLSGPELCARLAANPFTRDIPVILLTAPGVDASHALDLAGNIRQCVAKPFSPCDLLALVEEELAADLVGVS